MGESLTDNDVITEIADRPISTNHTKPTMSRKCKALELLGISSNESGANTPSKFNHSFSYNASFSRKKNKLINYPSYSSRKSSFSKSKSKSSRFLRNKKDDNILRKKSRSLRRKLSKSKSTKSAIKQSMDDVPDQNPKFLNGKQPVLTHSSSNHCNINKTEQLNIKHH